MRLLIAFSLFVCVAICAQEPLQIPVVRTWKELFATPEITLKDGQKVRVGIEALRAPEGSHVCLYVSGGHQKERSREFAGPLKIVGLEEPEEQLALVADEPTVIVDEPLWGRPIAVRKDAQRISLQDGDTVVATAELKSSTQTFHWWLMVRTPDGAADTPAAFTLVNTDNWAELLKQPGRALADSSRMQWRVDDRLPHLLTNDDEEPGPNEKSMDPAELNHLVSQLGSDSFEDRATASAALLKMGDRCLPHLKAMRSKFKDNEICLRLDELIRTLEGDFRISWKDGKVLLQFWDEENVNEIENHLVARWWVNGSPVKPTDAGDLTPEKMKTASDFAPRAETSLKFVLDAQLLGAKSGDRLQLQLMFLPEGVSDGSSHDKRKELNDFRSDSGRGPTISNKIEFKMP